MSLISAASAMGVLMGLAFALGYRLGNRPSSSPLKAVKPVCSCGHGPGFHWDMKGRCSGTRRGYATHRCTCSKYDGPIPLDSYYAREIAE